jgi:hypothetical protein
MSFILNAGEFDLGAGFIGRGTILAGEAYAVGTDTTGVQGILNTSGLEGLSFSMQVGSGSNNKQTGISFRESNDSLIGTILQPTQFSTTLTGSASCFLSTSGSLEAKVSYASPLARWHLALGIQTANNLSNSEIPAIINSSDTSSIIGVVQPQDIHSLYTPFVASLGWRFLARDNATALTHYPSTAQEGSIFAASCVDSATQWGLWAAGEVGDRNAYFNQTQGYFAIVILRNGASWYFSVFSPAVSGSSSRNDSRLRSVNIIPKPGQSGDDRFSELLLFRDQGNGYSERLGTVPGLIYVDMNRAENAALVVGGNLTIEPGVGTTYDLTNNGALIVAQWGLDISATISNVGSTFTVDTISSPTSATLAAGNRNRWILENNQRIRFTATPPSGVSAGTDYWILNWDPVAFTFQVASTEGGAAIVPGGDTSSTIVRYAPLIAMPCYKED